MSEKMRGLLQEMVAMMDRGDEHGAGSNWHRAALEALAEQPAQGEAVAQIVNGELMWFIPHQSYALDAKFRSGRWTLYTAPPAPAVPDGWKLVPDYKCADDIITSLYRRFKEWSARGFNAEDVTWCEVKADILALLAAAPEVPRG